MLNNPIVKEIMSWVKVIAFAVFFAWIITTFILVNATVPTGSMETTIMINDRLIANRLAYAFHGPEQGDIVVFRFPDDRSKLYIKRVIGWPGDKIDIRGGLVYINNADKPLDESAYLAEAPDPYNGSFTVPDNAYFMMGDNRNNSNDSRFWINKYVPRSDILGKAIFKYFPGFKLLNRLPYTTTSKNN